VRTRGAVALVAALVLTPDAALAQQLVPPPEPPPLVAPGWTITPSVGAASSWDDNVALTSPEQGELADQVTTALTSLASQYRGRRGEFLLEYRGRYDFYRRYTTFNAPDHRARLDFERRLGRRITGFARDSFSSSPTTDVPFADAGLLILQRRTTSANDFSAGVDITPGSRSVITASYGNQWIDLVGDEQVQPLLRGGYAHRGEITMRRQLWPRLAVGGAYDLQHAIVSRGQESFQIQRAAALVDYAIAPTLTLSGRAGWAWQTAGPAGDQSAPSMSADLRYQAERTLWTIGYERTYLASFGFGGTVQNRALRASVDAPLSRRVGVTARVTARENDPLIAEGLALRGVSGEGFITFTLASWLHLETFVVTNRQDTQLAGGRITRTRAGVRLITLHPMRLR
jgi:hypothetical protein